MNLPLPQINISILLVLFLGVWIFSPRFTIKWIFLKWVLVFRWKCCSSSNVQKSWKRYCLIHKSLAFFWNRLWTVHPHQTSGNEHQNIFVMKTIPGAVLECTLNYTTWLSFEASWQDLKRLQLCWIFLQSIVKYKG